MNKSKIVGLGHFVPERIVTNSELSTMMDTSNEWIIERTGIEERRWINPNKDTLANMSAKAAKIAIQNADINSNDIDFIILATITPDYFFPGSGVLLQRELGLTNVPAMDIKNACSGFIFALSTADQFIKTGKYKNILVVGAEIQSTALDVSTRGRNTAVIFGDGAGAAILQPSSDENGIISTHLFSDGNFAEELYVKDPGSSRPREERQPEQIFDTTSFKVHMNGNLVFKYAVSKMIDAITIALDYNNFEQNQIDLLIPHQANLRISNFIQEKMKLDSDRIFNNIMYYGNTTAASIPIALSEAHKKGLIKSGNIICLAAFGSGFSWGSSLIKW